MLHTEVKTGVGMQRRWLIGAVIVAALLSIGIVVFVATNGDESKTKNAVSPPSTSVRVTTTTTPSQPEKTAPVDVSIALFPSSASAPQFSDPVSVARAFATRYLRFASIRDDAGHTLAASYVMGGANGEMGPFEATLAFTTPSTPMGAVIYATFSPGDGSVLEASVVRVRLG
jgi:hypothetical protein